MIIPHCMITKKSQNYTRKNITDAAKQLTGIAFKLYIYFITYPENHFLYERADFIKICGGSVNSVNRAFDELINFGFLKTNDEKNFIFFSILEENKLD